MGLYIAAIFTVPSTFPTYVYLFIASIYAFLVGITVGINDIIKKK